MRLQEKTPEAYGEECGGAGGGEAVNDRVDAIVRCVGVQRKRDARSTYRPDIATSWRA